MKTKNFTDELLYRLSNATNRSLAQTKFLFELCDHDLSKLMELEEKLKNNHVFYCPGDKEETEKVLSMENGNFFKVEFLAKYNL
jgi:hypothetical protein